MALSVGKIIYISPSEYLEHYYRISKMDKNQPGLPFGRMQLRSDQSLGNPAKKLLAKITGIKVERWSRIDAVYQNGKAIANAINQKNPTPSN